MQGYHVVKTPDIPAVAAATELAHHCMASAPAIMQLLKDTCRADGASYVLQKDAASETIRLFELQGATSDQAAVAGSTDADCAHQAPEPGARCGAAEAPPAVGSHSALQAPRTGNGDRHRSSGEEPARPYTARVARLCYHMAVRILDGGGGTASDAGASTDNGQAALLLRRCMQLTSSSADPHMFACAALRLAGLQCGDGYTGTGSAASAPTGAASSTGEGDAHHSSQLGLLEVAAVDLQDGLSALECDMPGQHPHLERSLRRRLFDVHRRASLLHAADGQPGRAHGCVAAALAYMERSPSGAPKQAQQHRELLRCAGVAYVAMVRDSYRRWCMHALTAQQMSIGEGPMHCTSPPCPRHYDSELNACAKVRDLPIVWTLRQQYSNHSRGSCAKSSFQRSAPCRRMPCFPSERTSGDTSQPSTPRTRAATAVRSQRQQVQAARCCWRPS